MSGRRILDAITFFNASRNVAGKHIALQKQTLDIRIRTSSLTKEAKSQAERISLAVQAASDLARKLDDIPVSSSTPENQYVPTAHDEAAGGVRDAVDGQSKQGIRRDDGLKKREDTGAYEDIQADQNINNSTFNEAGTLPKSRGEGSKVSPEAVSPENRGAVSGDELPEHMMNQLFRSPKTTKSLFRDRMSDLRPHDLGKISPTATPMSGLGSRKDIKNIIPGGNLPRISELNSTSPVSAAPTNESALNAQNIIDGNTISPQSQEIAIEDVESNISPKSEYKMVQSRVPSSRIGRLWEYGGLATSMAFGVVGESIRRATGNDEASAGSLLLSPANIERLVMKLSRMRGAALKLGQMLSFQDSKMLPESIQEVLQRVQDKADYMPASQRDKVLVQNLGSNWRDLFESFDDVPMAAASIGQVHGAVLKETGQRVAVKVQYPGVADSIDSDLNNLSVLLTASRLLPKGLYLDKTIANARTELGWECDYIREAECSHRFKQLLQDETATFTVPEVIPSASGKQVLTMERLDGIAVTKIQSFTQSQRDWIGTQLLRLCLREICEFRYMQTDPNWTNFLYNSTTNRLELLDFGASRDYPASFISLYLRLLIAASRNDRETCRDISVKLGYLTGFESQPMIDAHVSSITTVAEPFMNSSPEVYDFNDQTITDRVRDFIPLMLRERMTPPPEETYSLHRKLSGAFLLCARLGSKVRCRELFDDALKTVEWVDEDEKMKSASV